MQLGINMEMLQCKFKEKKRNGKKTYSPGQMLADYGGKFTT